MATRSKQARAQAPAVAPQEERVPRWLPPVLYAFAAAIMFRETVFTGASLLGMDTVALSYFAREFYTEAVRGLGQFPLWNPLLFGGLPFVEGMHGDIFYPFSLALFFLDARTMWGWKMVLHVFLAGIFAYLWLRRGMELRRGPALFGGLVFMLGADLVSLVYPGGDGKLFVSALAPLMFWLTERCVRHRRIGDFAFFALGLALVMFTSHMQLAYFTVWGVSAYFLFRVWQVWRTERSGARAAVLVGMFAAAGVAGVGAAAVQFLPPLQYLREWSQRADNTDSDRGYEYSTSYSLHPEEIVSLVVPEFIGDNVPTDARGGNTYWGRNGFKLNHEYAGFIPLLLIPLLFMRVREQRTWFFAALALGSLLYALGANTPLFRVFYLIPGVSLFRAPSLIIFLYGLSVATLGAIALQRLIDWTTGAEDLQSAAVRYLWIATAVMGVLALASAAIPGIWTATIFRDIAPQQLNALQNNTPNIRIGFWITFMLTLLTAIAAYGSARAYLSGAALLTIVSGLAFLDLYRVDRPFVRGTVMMNAMVDPAMFAPDETVRFLLERQAAGETFRVFDIGQFVANQHAYPANTFAIHGIEQLTGHHGNEMRYYEQLMGGHESAPAVATSELRVLERANATYVVSPARLAVPQLEEVFVGSRSAVYRLPNALPRAYVVGNVEVIEDVARSAERVLAADFDARTSAVLAAPLPAGVQVQPGAQGSARFTARAASEATIEVQADGPSLLMVLDNYYPAWRAEVDGEAVPIVRANHTFRAIPVPAGTHTVRMYYDPAALRLGAITSIVLLLALLVAGVVGTALRPRSSPVPAPAPA